MMPITIPAWRGADRVRRHAGIVIGIMVCG
jgi:hypothetical protein